MTLDETIRLRGLDYGVSAHGDPADATAPLVLLLHGFAGSAGDWDRVAALLAAGGCRAVAVDLPGHGRTATGAGAGTPPERFRAESTASDLVALLDHFGVARAHWAGYSMGGRIALVAALAHPGRVATLTLESAGGGIANPGERADRVRSDEVLAASIESRGVAWFAETWETLPLFESQRSLPAATRAEVAAARRRNEAAGLAASLRGVGQGAQPYVGDDVAGFPRSTLLVTGALDAKYNTLAATLAPRFPAARHAVATGAGHNVHLEQPEWFARSLLDHLRQDGVAVPREATATR